MTISAIEAPLLGRLRITSELGRGGFGVVYVVVDGSGREFAAKVIGPLTGADAEETFNREIEAAVRLNHPNVIAVLDHGIIIDGAERFAFTVMDLCRDGDYRKELRRKQAADLDVDSIVRDFRQILEGLAAIHQTLIHRDLKPENVLVSGGVLQVTDFGLSKLVDEATRSLSFKGGGTPRYMAPETWLMQRASQSTDLYAVGTMLFEALTGTVPFAASDINKLREQHLYQPAPRVRAIRPEVPDYLDGIVKRLLDKEPSKRYQTAQSVINELHSIPTAEPTAAIGEIVGRIQRQRDLDEQRVLERRAREDAARTEIEKNKFKENEVIDLIDGIVKEINQHLPGEKIQKGRQQTETVYRVGHRTLRVHFFRPNELIVDPKVPGRMETLRQRHVSHGGYIEIQEHGQDRQGWNLVLVRPPGSLYGDWIIVETEVSPLTGRMPAFQPFATEAQLFAENLAYHWMRAMHIYVLKDKALERSDILKILVAFAPGGS